MLDLKSMENISILIVTLIQFVFCWEKAPSQLAGSFKADLIW